MDKNTGLTIVGFHGTMDPLFTPALHAAVFVDADSEMVSPDTRERIGVRIPTEGELPGDGTRIGPWPAEGNELVFGLSRTLVSEIQEFWIAK